MKKIFAVFLITLFCACFAFSQEPKPTPDWQTFAPEGEEFSVETPVALNGSRFNTVRAMSDNTSRRYLNLLDGTYFFIFSDSQKKTWNLDTVQKFVKNYAQTGTPENFGNFDGEKFVFTDAEDFYHTVLIVKSKKRAYVFQTVSPTKDNAAVERFFGSLKFQAKTDGEKTVEPTMSRDLNLPAPDSQTRRFPVPTGGKYDASGIGNGRTNQTNPETTPSTTPTNATTGVKILSKPRANYTDFARFYEIKGRVVLRVPFLADGTIGDVEVIARLPFGLTQEAIAAAKGIRFEPGLKEGVPYSATKAVEYGFSIF